MRKIEIKRFTIWLTSLLLAPAMLGAGQAAAADSAPSSDLLLNLFVEKGYVSKSEADKVKAEAEQRQAELNQYKETAAALKAETEALRAEVATLRAQADFSSTNDLPALEKSKMSNALEKMVVFGDIRLRYEQRSAEDPQGGKITLNRERYSLRLGVRGDLTDDFNYGLRLETSSNPRSSWTTFGTSTASGSGGAYQGPYGKSTASINVGQAYIGWHHDDWIEITLGKMPNPLYTTTLVWSGSINPEGAAETFKHSVGEADFFTTFGQFVYEDTNPNQASRVISSIIMQVTAAPSFCWLGKAASIITSPRMSPSKPPPCYIFTAAMVPTPLKVCPKLTQASATLMSARESNPAPARRAGIAVIRTAITMALPPIKRASMICRSWKSL